MGNFQLRVFFLKKFIFTIYYTIPEFVLESAELM